MTSLNDLELNHSTSPPIAPPKNRALWVAIVVAIVFVGAGLWYYTTRRTTTVKAPVAPAPVQETVQAKKEVSSVAPLDIVVPPLAETDPLVRKLLGELSSHPTILAWLATKGLIENFTVVTLNISQGRTPKGHLQALAPRGRFRTKGSDNALYLDARSYERYNGSADAVSALDATGTARLYNTLKPRILDAYRQLGYPEGDFDPTLERAIAELLKVPVIQEEVPLRPKVLTYTFADPRLESLSAAQKQFLRMGPRNVQAIQAKLSEIAALLNLHPTR